MRLQIGTCNFGPVPFNAFEIDQPRDTRRGPVEVRGQFFEHTPLVRHEPHVNGFARQNASRRPRNGSFLPKHGGILPFINLAQNA